MYKPTKCQTIGVPTIWPPVETRWHPTSPYMGVFDFSDDTFDYPYSSKAPCDKQRND